MSDHRTLTGQRRRADTRKRIIEAAIPLFAQGGEVLVIEDFVRVANVSRGTFYNYFRTVEELHEAAEQWQLNILNQQVEAKLVGLSDPVERFACALRFYLETGRQDMAWSGFMARLEHGAGSAAERRFTLDLRQGQKDGLFAKLSSSIAYDVVNGLMMRSFARMAVKKTCGWHLDEVVRTAMRALGASSTKVEQALEIFRQRKAVK
ncbi:TetR/AcrR family transcriptional regulator [Acidocella sp.]|uniref:TetR/AcrR family transcriptional regulator n=1 Tax=Acidocella sp. TaxID=50710 RepID=UPI003D06FC39